MGIIHILSSSEAQKIAAGEVVERPYNIVKELLENSLDAGATQIKLYIEDGGRKSIRCIDNGCGMSQEDARMSVEHHATSKLTTIEDLESIKTFGFRGEALSSICSVSTMAIATQMHDQHSGIQLSFEYAFLKNTEIISRPPGTDITITNIFENVPVRKKFLKTRETEWRAIFTLVQAIALAHKHVVFMLYHDNQQILTTYATDSLTERVAQIFDRNFSEHFLACESNDLKNNITISGGITHYQYQRYDRNQQFFFVNKRWVKNYKLGQAFNKGFLNVLPPGKHPAGILFIELAHHEVDINVHPRKEEVVFLHPRLIELAVERMVQKRLETETAQRVQTTKHATQESVHYPVYPSYTHAIDGAKHIDLSMLNQTPQSSAFTMSQCKSYPPLEIQQPVTQSAKQILQKEYNYTIVGQLLKTYLLLETPDGLLTVDQHAAHECVLYEQFSSNNNEVTRMQLLFPEIISVLPEDQKTLLSLISELNRVGIHIESVSNSAIAVTETPLHVKNYPLKDLVHDILSWIHESSVIQADIWNAKITKKLYAMMACKAAVKAGDELSKLQIEELLNSLYKTEHRMTCPHGRPTTWAISQYELEKTFKRKI
ncbi:MAG: DNA mismatch repair endonuclease MutL [Candidatus Babeliaceae bacterium]|nr:DNA mismatch repair endonuclease MutL [Candidatus Babeliaceae bacterium]